MSTEQNFRGDIYCEFVCKRVDGVVFTKIVFVSCHQNNAWRAISAAATANASKPAADVTESSTVPQERMRSIAVITNV